MFSLRQVQYEVNILYGGVVGKRKYEASARKVLKRNTEMGNALRQKDWDTKNG